VELKQQEVHSSPPVFSRFKAHWPGAVEVERPVVFEHEPQDGESIDSSSNLQQHGGLVQSRVIAHRSPTKQDAEPMIESLYQPVDTSHQSSGTRMKVHMGEPKTHKDENPIKEQLEQLDLSAYNGLLSTRSDFVCFNLNDTRLFRENSTYINGKVFFSYKGVDLEFELKDFFGQKPKYRLVYSITGTELCIYRLNTLGLPNCRVREDGLTHNEFQRLLNCANTRRSDKTPVNPQQWYSVYRQALGECWLSTLYSLSVQSLQDEYIRCLDKVDLAKSKKIWELSKGIKEEWRWYHYMMRAIFFCLLAMIILTSLPAGIGGSLVSVLLCIFLHWYVPKIWSRLRHFAVFLWMKMRNWRHFSKYKHAYSLIEFKRDLGDWTDTVFVRPGAAIIQMFKILDGKEGTVKAVLSHYKTSLSSPKRSLYNIVTGTVARQMGVKGNKDENALIIFKERVRNLLPQIFEPYDGDMTPYAEWLQDRDWQLIKKIKYDDSYTGYCELRPYRNNFIKNEVVMAAHNKPARLISASHSDVQCHFGPLFCDLKKNIVSQTKPLQNKGRVTICAGMTVMQLGETLEQLSSLHKNPQFCGADFSKFDSSINEHLLEVEGMVYKHVLPEYSRKINEYIAYIRKHWMAVANDDGYAFKAKIPPSRATGDPTTTLGNCVINKMIWEVILAYTQIDAHVMINGDDVLLIADPVELYSLKARAEEYIDKLGMCCEIESPVKHPAQVNFLSGFFVHGKTENYEGLIHVPRLGSIMSRTTITSKHWSCSDQLLRLKHSKLTAIKTMAWYCPQLQAKAATLLTLIDMQNVKMDWTEMGYNYVQHLETIKPTQFTEECVVMRYGADYDPQQIADDLSFSCESLDAPEWIHIDGCTISHDEGETVPSLELHSQLQ
jgi:hypothetical protein